MLLAQAMVCYSGYFVPHFKGGGGRTILDPCGPPQLNPAWWMGYSIIAYIASPTVRWSNSKLCITNCNVNKSVL